MSGKFNGFTKEDINHLTSKIENKENVTRSAKVVGLRRLPDTKAMQPPPPPPQTSTHQQIRKHNNPQPPTRTTTATITGKKPVYPVDDDSSSNDSTLNTNLHDAMTFKPLPPKLAPEDESILQSADEENGNVAINNYSEFNNSPFKGMSLKDFEAQRRIVEEQNKQKKELLFKTIEQHSERTAAEVKKLQDIKKELTKLDSELAADVAILRKQIESASFQFMQVQKNYQQIESMFLKAKLDMHQAEEKKELLTEHLCTIIAHNEDRKAKKLTELMEKVGISENPMSEE